MKESTVRGALRKRTAGFRALIPAGLLCIVISCSANGFGEYVNEYIDVSIGSDGTIYATGTTDAGWMSEHSAWVETYIKSPAGRYGYGQGSVDSGGYVSADASLPFDSTDTGEYDISATGDGVCYVYGDLGEAFAGTYLELGIDFICYYNPVYTGEGYANYVRKDPCPLDCGSQQAYQTADVLVGSPPPPYYILGWAPTWLIGGVQYCGLLGGWTASDSNCQCHHLP